MSRKRQAVRRKVDLDPIFDSALVTKLINSVMQSGKKSTAQKIVYQAFDLIKTKTSKEPLEVFQLAVENVTPVLEVKSRRIGGANYQVPVEVSQIRKQTLALRWIINYARLRTEYTMIEKLANEIIDASNKTGATIKKKEDTHKMAEANKAFAHYRW